MNTPKTATIAGHTLTLESGKRYMAARPAATGKRNETFPIRIYELSNLTTPVLTVTTLPYDEANEFLAAFNDGETSFEGRIW